MQEFYPEIEAEAMAKLEAMTNNAENEIGGLLKVETIKGQPRVTDVILLEQQANYGEFQLEENALLKFFTKINKKEGITNSHKYCGWVHKHPTIGWSQQDDETFQTLLEDWDGFVLGIVKQSNDKYLWRLDMARMDQKKNILNYISVETEDFKIICENKKIEEKMKQQIKKLVKEMPTPTFEGLPDDEMLLNELYQNNTEEEIQKDMEEYVPEDDDWDDEEEKPIASTKTEEEKEDTLFKKLKSMFYKDRPELFAK